MKKRFAILLILLGISLLGCSNQSITDQDITDQNNNNELTDSHEPVSADFEIPIAFNEFISENKINATVVVSSLNSEKGYTHNPDRAEERFLPASTFKIPNTLIALQEGVISDENEMIKWDGQDKGLPQWNKDQSLRTAFPSSCVWFYQELARRIGLEKYEHYLNELDYGNRKIGASVDTFWLEGEIKISALEQINFLKKIYQEEFEFNQSHYTLLKDLMVVEEEPAYILRAKTGWAKRTASQVGWYVGYLETEEDVWFFSCNLEIHQDSDANYREELVMRLFKDLEIIK